MAEVQPPGFLNGPPVSTDAAVYRDQTAALAGDRAGVCGATHFAVFQSGTPGMSVDVAAGKALIDATTVNGLFTARNDAAIVNLAISPANPTNPRIDRAVIEVRPGSPNDDWRVFIVAGTPALSPAPPPVPDNAELLADIAVAAAASAIVTANITDRRRFAGDWGMSWGAVAYSERPSGFGPVTSITNIGSCEVSFSAVAGRRYRTTGKIMVQAAAANSNAQLQIRNSADARLDAANGHSSTPSGQFVLSVSRIETCAAAGTTLQPGSTTRKLALGPSGGAVAITGAAGSDFPAYILVEDIGPA